MKQTQYRKQWMARMLLALALMPACGRALAQKTGHLRKAVGIKFE